MHASVDVQCGVCMCMTMRCLLTVGAYVRVCPVCLPYWHCISPVCRHAKPNGDVRRYRSASALMCVSVCAHHYCCSSLRMCLRMSARMRLCAQCMRQHVMYVSACELFVYECGVTCMHAHIQTRTTATLLSQLSNCVCAVLVLERGQHPVPTSDVSSR